ncbi:MAG: hypothetical protein CL779_00695 [Chloroflexi bacterium]|nr:hypothetical protein [Chloroflexota bacterium]
MANPTDAAGDNGVSGSTSGISGGDTAIRKSVAGTQGGTYSRSDVYSETMNLRFAYHNGTSVECDTPTMNRS